VAICEGAICKGFCLQSDKRVACLVCLHQAETASSGSKILHRMHVVFVHMASTGGDRTVAELVAQKSTVTHMSMSVFVLNICLFNFEVQEKQRKTVQLRV
jgi:hypothetical protein